MSAIQFNTVSKSFLSKKASGNTVHAVQNVDFKIQQGEFFGLLGPNGAGKTTLINMLAGLTKPSSGSIQVLGKDVVQDYRDTRRSLGIVPQELVFDPFFSVIETLKIQSGYFGLKNNLPWIEELLESLGLSDKANANMRQLSGGMKRRVLVAQALVHKPPVIVLHGMLWAAIILLLAWLTRDTEQSRNWLFCVIALWCCSHCLLQHGFFAMKCQKLFRVIAA